MSFDYPVEVHAQGFRGAKGALFASKVYKGRLSTLHWAEGRRRLLRLSFNRFRRVLAPHGGLNQETRAAQSSDDCKQMMPSSNDSEGLRLRFIVRCLSIAPTVTTPEYVLFVQFNLMKAHHGGDPTFASQQSSQSEA